MFPNPSYDTPYAPEDVVLADFNNDGIDDIVTGKTNGFGANLLEGEGGGTFSYHSGIGSDYPAVAVEAADFNGDGYLDVVTGGNQSTGGIEIHLNRGFSYPSFESGESYYVSRYINDIEVADFDNDGDIDIANITAGTVTAFFNDGSANFTPLTLNIGFAPTSVLAEDLNGDGLADIAATTDNFVSIRLNLGNQIFAETETYQIAQDYDGNGDDAQYHEAYSLIAFDIDNDGDGTFGNAFAPNGYTVDGGYLPRDVVAEDLDGDGDSDLAIGDAAGEVTVWLYEGYDDFYDRFDWAAPTVYTAFGTSHLTGADFDGDNDIDLAAGSTDGIVTLLLNQLNQSGDTTPPTITGVFNVDAQMPEIRLVFSENVEPSFSASDVIFVNLTTGESIDQDAIDVIYDVATNIATFTFPGLPGGMLPNGQYTATVAGSVSDAAGNVLENPYVFDFFVLAGDANRDRIVDLADFVILRNNFGTTASVFSQGDFNYDGVVDLADFVILRNNFGQTLDDPDEGPGLFG